MRVALLVLALLPVALAAQPADLDLDAARAVVDTLAAPRYYGRGFAFDGATRAAQFLEGRFEAAGLQPLGPAWRHPFPYEADIVTDVPVLTMDRAPLVLGTDLLPYPSTAAGAGTAVGALDVGSGVVVPPAGIDAYAGRPVEGRVVVLSAAVPDSLVGDENVPQAYLSEVARYEIAFLRGASAVVHLVDAPLFGTSFYDAKLPVFHVRREAWTSPATVDFRMDAEQNRPVTGYNVLGAVPGTVRPDSVLLITAHYDGLGSFGAEVYFPGANDNASGVALLLALAKRVAREPLPYTVVFAALGAEEVGLVGAQALAAAFGDGLGAVRFVLNFDMAASGEDGLVAFGGRDHPDLFERLEAVNEPLGLGPLVARSNRPNSDHAVFAAQGVPALYLLTKDGTQPYHALDDVPETLDWEAFAHLYALTADFLETVGANGVDPARD